MIKTTRIALLAAAWPLGAMWAPDAQASGFYLQEQSTRAIGRAFSGEAADSGPDSLWWNPAAIGGQRGCEMSAHASVILPRGKVVNTGTSVTRPTGLASPPLATTAVSPGQVQENPIVDGFLPSGAGACGITDRIALGVAVTSPFSFTTQYPSDSWTRYSALRSHLRTIDVQPGVAIMIADGLSIGGAVNIEQVNAELTNALPDLTPLSDGYRSLTGSGWDLGWSVGVRLARGPFEMGASYKSSIEHKLDGQVVVSGLITPQLRGANGTTSAVATFNTPWQAMFGVRAHVSPRLTLNGQVVASGWGEFDAIRLGAPLNRALEQNYRDVFSYAAGLDYKASEKLTLRTGVQYDEGPTRDGFRDARVPDADRLNFAAGASYDLSERFSVDAAFLYSHFDSASIDRPDAPYAPAAPYPAITTSGRLEDARAFVFSLGARARF